MKVDSIEHMLNGRAAVKLADRVFAMDCYCNKHREDNLFMLTRISVQSD